MELTTSVWGVGESCTEVKLLASVRGVGESLERSSWEEQLTSELVVSQGKSLALS